MLIYSIVNSILCALSSSFFLYITRAYVKTLISLIFNAIKDNIHFFSLVSPPMAVIDAH